MEKRKFLFVSLSGLIGDIAWQVLKEGHEVRYYIDNEKERDIADGFVPKSTDWEQDCKVAVVGIGQTMKQAQSQVYARIKNILIPNMYYRTDIGDRWAEDFDKLHNWGYLR